MGLKKTRTILSVFLSFVTAAATLITLVSVVINMTLASPSFFAEKLITPQVVNECSKQLHMKYKSLEAESGIPARVFETVTQDSGVEFSLQTAAANIFLSESSILYNEERVNYFYRLCTEYFSGNGMEYNKKNVLRVSEKAARIYSDTLGIHNTESIEKYISGYKQNCLKTISAGIIVIAVCYCMLCLIYKKRADILFFAGYAGAGGGSAAVIGAVICLILKTGSDIAFYPAVYQQSLYSMVKLSFIYLLMIGIVCTVISGILIIFAVKAYKKERKRRELN